MNNVLVLNGPNLARLGTREPDIYGAATFEDLVALCRETGRRLGLHVEVRQTDDEAAMIHWVHEAADTNTPIVLNPAAFTHVRPRAPGDHRARRGGGFPAGLIQRYLVALESDYLRRGGMVTVTGMRPAGRLLIWVYGAIAFGALIATWSQNIRFFLRADNGGVLGFLQDCYVNPAAASITNDILFVWLAAIVLMVVESRRLGIRHVWVYALVSLLVALSVAVPLFLIARQLRLARDTGVPALP